MKALLLSTALGGALLATPALAQVQNNSETVGPPVLRDFQLPGERTVAPPPPPPPPRAAPTPPPTSAPTPSPAARPPAPAPRTDSPVPKATPSIAQPEAVPILPPAEPVATEPLPSPTPAPPPPPSAPLAEPSEDFPWLYAAGGGLAVLALLAWLATRRRRPRPETGRVSMLAAAEPEVPPAEPVQALQAARARIELEFRPAKAAATDQLASVDYELVVRNTGEAPARNLRAEARMFNAGKQIDSEIRAFFGAPEAKNAALYPLPLAPGEDAVVKGQVAIQKQEVREVVIEGRRLFVPMVAFNVTYEWGEGESGQTSMSYLVGRESDPPAEKMAAFRLDLGPRIYRSVGFRPSRIALTV